MSEQISNTSPGKNELNKNQLVAGFAKVIQIPLSLKALPMPGNMRVKLNSITDRFETLSEKDKPPRILLNHSNNEINQHIPLILSSQFKKDIYHINLSQLVEKYIGETEKNIESIFKNAEEKNWILFFDEADALFGKRSEVRDAHDKYANLEVNYLLQQIENYNGIVLIKCSTENCLALCSKHHFESLA